MSQLRPYQQAAIEKFMGRPDRRLILAHATSAGKTRTAIECAAKMGAKRVLIACPAIARPTWLKQFGQWAPDYAPQAIRFGRTRKNLTKAQTAEREAAYAADVQVVSYKLLKEIHNEPRDLLILDELHALRDPLSQQSKVVRAYRAAHPQIAMLGLSATLIPTEVRQLWCPLDTFWPGQWGRKHPAGDVSWEFQARYCYREENEWGVRYVGSKSPEALLELAERLSPYVHRVTDKEVAPYLPPLHAEPLYLDEVRDPASVAQEWARETDTGDASHIAVICYNRDTAWDIAARLDTQYVVTGETNPEQRQLVLDSLREAPRGILVATCESVREAISLSFCSRALILQWRTSPAQAIQLMGRFPRQDAADLTRPTFIQYVVQPGEEAKADILRSRIKDIQQIMASDKKADQLVEIFQPRPLTDDMLDMMFVQMMGGFNPERDSWAEEQDG